MTRETRSVPSKTRGCARWKRIPRPAESASAPRSQPAAARLLAQPSAPTIRLAARPRTPLHKSQRRHPFLPAWTTQWQFWLVVALGTILRLLPLHYSPFGIDDALLMLEATRAVHDHLIPGTGIYSSLLTLNPPLYTFILLPFADQPMGMVVLTALANIVAIAGLYIFAQAFFGRRVALLSGMLYSTACYDTYLSTFIWQQTLLAPFSVAALATLYLAAVRRRPGFWTLHLLLVVVLTLLYPPMVSLLALTLAGLVLSWRTVRWRFVALGALGGLVLAVPSLLFELASNGIDLPVYQAYLTAPKRTDGAIFAAIVQSLGPLPQDYLGAQTLYGQGAGWLEWLAPAIFVLAALSVAWLALEVGAPLVSQLTRRDVRAARVLFDNAEWRARLLLVVWPLGLVAMMLSHSSPIYVHYAFIVTPPLYLALGLFLARAPAQLDALLSTYRGRVFTVSRRIASVVASGILAAQTLATVLFVLTFALGQAAEASRGELALSGYTRALAVADADAARIGASELYFVSEATNPYSGLYWSTRENALRAAAASPGARAPTWVSYVAGDCALTPPAQQGSGLLLLADNRGLAARQLLMQPGVRLLDSVAVAPNTVFPVYATPAAAPAPLHPLATFNGELRLESARVAAATLTLPRRLLTQWTVLAAPSPADGGVYQYHFHFTFTSATGSRKGASDDTWAECAPSAWGAGEGITLVTPLPPMLTAKSWNAHLVVTRDTHTWYRPQLGPLTLETAKELTLDPVTLPLGTGHTGGIANPDKATLAAATVTLASGDL